jgi:hypothetical protein
MTGVSAMPTVMLLAHHHSRHTYTHTHTHTRTRTHTHTHTHTRQNLFHIEHQHHNHEHHTTTPYTLREPQQHTHGSIHCHSGHPYVPLTYIHQHSTDVPSHKRTTTLLHPHRATEVPQVPQLPPLPLRLSRIPTSTAGAGRRQPRWIAQTSSLQLRLRDRTALRLM